MYRHWYWRQMKNLEMSHRLRVAGQPATEYALTGRVVISADSIVGGAATKYLKLGPYYFSTEVEKAGKNKIGRDEVRVFFGHRQKISFLFRKLAFG